MDTRTESIQKDIDQTQNSMNDKMEEIEDRVRGTTQDVRSSMDETVDRTVDTVKNAVSSNVEQIKDNVDVQGMVEKHPWLMVGGSMLAGYILSSLTQSSSHRQDSRYDRYDYVRGDTSSDYPASSSDQHRRTRSYAHENDSGRRYAAQEAPSSRTASVKATSADFVDEVLGQFREEVDTLKDATVATMTRILRDTLHDNLPQLAEEFERARTERQQHGESSVRGAHLDTPQDQDRSTSIVEPAAVESDAVPSSSAVQKQNQDSSTSSIVETERTTK